MTFGRVFIDFETRSFADLKLVGEWIYSRHPSTEVICLCYQIVYSDGRVDDIQEWCPLYPADLEAGMPRDLKWAILSGFEVEAHKYSFELSVWMNVCVPRYGFCPIRPEQWRDTMAVACYYAMPAALDALCRALRIPGKDPEGARLITKYCKLHLKTAKTEIPPEDLRKFIDYCKRDVAVERMASDILGDLPDRELENFRLDQTINMRGLYLDVAGIDAATLIVDERSEHLTARFQALTGLNPTQGAKLLVWFGEHGLKLDNMQAAYLEELIEEGNVPPGPAREAMDIRLKINKASTKKLDAMSRQRDTDGRARWQTRYHGASTGRDTGGGFQPLNLVRSWEDVEPDDLVRDVMYGNGAWLDACYGDAMEAVSKAGRHWIKAEDGNRIVAGDFVSIEAVMLACLAGEDWKVEAFRQGRKIYELMGDKIHGLAEGTVTKKTHPDMRQDGKTCLGAGTQILTQRGYVAITEVTRNDQVWDGEEWVSHDGVVCQGTKDTMTWQGVEVTPDHKILCGAEWANAATVSSSAELMRLALERGSENSLSLVSSLAQRAASSRYGLSALAALESTLSQKITSAMAGLHDARLAPPERPAYGTRISGALPTSAPMTRTGAGCSTASLLASLAANQEAIKITAFGVSSCMSLGPSAPPASEHSSHISCPSPAGTSPRWRLIAGIMMSAIGRAIFGSLRVPKTTSTRDKCGSSNRKSPALKPVYDLLNAGQRRRFTILTDAGPVIVHNCELAFGYQGALGAWLKFDSSGRHTDERIIEICKTWRGEHPMIVKFWSGLNDAAIEAVSSAFFGEPVKTQYRDIGFEVVDEWLSMILPNEKRLWYRDPELRTGMPRWHNPEAKPDCAAGSCKCRPQAHITYMAQKEGQWRRVATYGGKLAENATQAASREYLMPSVKAAEKAGYPVILKVYDEVVAEVPNGHGSLEEFLELLKNAPGREWAKGYPIGVDGWEGQRYRK